MVEKKEEPEKQAEPRQTSGQGSTTQAGVVELLASILNEVRKQVQSETPKPLEGKAVEAVEQFREIVAALALQPTVTLKVDQIKLTCPGNVILTWTSTDAQTISLDKEEVGKERENIQELTPTACGSIEVRVPATTTFIATAKGPCGSATARADVTVTVIG